MTKTIFFDFWGTLIEQGVWSPIKQAGSILHIYLPFPIYVNRLQKAMMTSLFNDLKSAFLALGEELNIDITRQEMDDLIGMWNKSWMLAEPYEDVAATLQQLQKEYDLVLVANTDSFSVDRVLDKYQLRPYFKKIFLSYQLGKTKSEEGFFDQIMDELGITIKDCVMVGDSLQSDILPAQKLGMKAILIDRRNSREAEGKITSLAELQGVLPW